MNIEFQARRYESASEIFAAAAERKRRMEAAASKVSRKAPRLVYSRDAEDAARIKNGALKPVWMKEPTFFNQHVIDFGPFREGLGRDWRGFIAIRAADFGLTYAEVMSRSRMDRIVHARCHIMYEIHKTGLKSMPEIGRMFDGRDHTSVLFAIRKVKAQIEGDQAAIMMVERKRARSLEHQRKCREVST